MADWVYPVNESSEAWDGSPFGEYFGKIDTDTWTLASGYRQIAVGDRLWVYGSSPYGRVIAVGLIVRPWAEVIAGVVQHRVDIEWDRETSRQLISAGPSDDLDRAPRGVRRLHDAELRRLESWVRANDNPLPSLSAARRRRLVEVVVRQGQSEFRDRLLEAYGGRCAISGCDTTHVLQAAHIAPFAAGGTNDVSNGLPLRADLHLLFDADLLWVDSNYLVRVESEVTEAGYRKFDGARLRLPTRIADRPNKDELRMRRKGLV
ncbi:MULTISPECIES: HNH endonuclease [unclassified Aeromicrobium]|uniref:HNH endonuclease n=1 Tax=unclassified Aeromicrobium TaxID=2633570 RepID=UPI00396B06E8